MVMGVIYMRIDPTLLAFPRYIPNDLEGLLLFYPVKYPPIVSDFEEIAPKIAEDPVAFREYGDKMRDELWLAFEKIKGYYEKGDQSDLNFLLDIDERFGKIYCYRFWIVNYLMADGPIHEFMVDNLKNLIHKFIDVTDDVEEFEQKVVRVQRDLLQSDYADMYLTSALDGLKAYELMQKHPRLSEIVAEATKLIDNHSHLNTEEINTFWEDAFKIIDNDEGAADIRNAMHMPLRQVKMRGTMLPVYNMLTHAVEFREENIKLAMRHGEMTSIIDAYKAKAKEELTQDDYDFFIVCYEQARNFAMYKDVMGAIDEPLLPLWFGIHRQIKEILMSRGITIRHRPTGPTAVLAHYVWYLPDELKARVMTPDLTPFNIETI